ncbi:MAG: hypothetical protein QOC81_1802 [Thermoanaerobaculia bacterium]|jgi:uncharacterized protein (DUF885 family)|nr:hypothetical protein [Thermoanaerobaculia bacterium]
MQTNAISGRDNNAAFVKLHDAYVIEFLRHNPSVNTYLGGAGLDGSLRAVDGRLRDHSQEALDMEDRWLAETESAMTATDPATLSAQHRIDREVALAQIRYQRHLHQVRKYQQRSVDTYTDEPFRAIDFQLQGMTQTGATTWGTDDEWSLVADRLAAIPRFLGNAEAQLRTGIAASNTPDYRMLYRNGIKTAESDAAYFETTLPKLADARIAGPQRVAILDRIRAHSAEAARAYLHFRDFVVTTFFDDPSSEAGIKPQFSGDRFLFGENEYNWALKNNLRVDKTAAQLYDESWPIVEQTQRDMIALAREIGAKHSWTLPADGNEAVRYVFDQLGQDYPKTDAEMIDWYRDAAFRLVDYSRKTGLFEVPADYKLDVVETPAPLRASIDGAAYYPAPPFKETGVGRFYVTPTDNDMAALKENNRAALADLSAHEGFPGHDWYYKVMTGYRKDVAPVRWLTPGAVEDSSSMWEDSMSAEGWGLYAEALMAEPQPGAPNGFYTPEERLYQLQGKLYRDLRVRIDIGIHTGRISYDDAVDLFSNIVNFLPGSCRNSNAQSDAKRASCKSAEGAIFRYSKWPTQAITYRLGKDEIYALRKEASQRLGAKFDLKRFHLLFIRQGSVPSGYFREELLRELEGP